MQRFRLKREIYSIVCPAYRLPHPCQLFHSSASAYLLLLAVPAARSEIADTALAIQVLQLAAS